MLPRRHRLTRPADFRAVLRRAPKDASAPPRRVRRRAGTDLLVVHLALGAASSDVGRSAGEGAEVLAQPARVGFVVSSAVGNSVIRHRVVRRLRALVAARVDRLPPGTDAVVRAQPPAARASSAELGQALDAALTKVLQVSP